MDAMTYTTVRANLSNAMHRVCNNSALIIMRNGEMNSIETYPTFPFVHPSSVMFSSGASVVAGAAD